MVSILGGKWTTYRSMAEDTMDVALKNATFPFKSSGTAQMKMMDATEKRLKDDDLCVLGAEKKHLPEYGSTLALSAHTHLSEAFIRFAIHQEFALTVEDILARRTRLLFLNVKEALHLAPEVAKIMANDLRKDEVWQKNQIREFNELAKKYQL
jgi:glycerol-3-phosphate dehydrogenase